MSTIIFDFDSTLISRESLEEILAPKLASRSDLDAQIREITRLGMEGTISFRESLSRRLALASPTLQEVSGFEQTGIQLLTPGIPELIEDLRDKGHRVVIVSGGLREAIIPVAHYLGLNSDDVAAVALRWNADGSFAGIDEADRFSISKVEGARQLAKTWSKPRIAVGDGMTDYHLYRDGLVEHFICFTQWARREPVLATGVPEARGVGPLTQLLEKLL